ncbi:hypothetical protein GF351_02520 [Candidatus Woesearchaeota archaeon]|nr:hypothetical protein [Candidatus Woesearchaeota archaeon]
MKETRFGKYLSGAEGIEGIDALAKKLDPADSMILYAQLAGFLTYVADNAYDAGVSAVNRLPDGLDQEQLFMKAVESCLEYENSLQSSNLGHVLERHLLAVRHIIPRDEMRSFLLKGRGLFGSALVGSFMEGVYDEIDLAEHAVPGSYLSVQDMFSSLNQRRLEYQQLASEHDCSIG